MPDDTGRASAPAGISLLRFLLFFLLALPVSASAQVIRGVVTDAATGAPIQTADVLLVGSKGEKIYTTWADDDGKFVLIIPNGKTVYVKTARIGYATVTSAPLTAKAGEQIEINVQLSPTAVALDPVKVVARNQVEPRLREYVQRASVYGKTGIGHIWTRADLEKRRYQMASHILRMTPGRPDFYCSGAVLMIDNVRIPDGMADVDLLVSTEDLEGVEIYRGTEIPVDLLTLTRPVMGESPCKLILMWRKPYAELYRPSDSTPTLLRGLATVGFAGVVVFLNVLAWRAF